VWKKLQSLGCDYAQGFYNSRPMPAAELVRWLMVTGVPVDNMASA
jgi:EAL domain-containing protein (putative c-di-GMP-specific phosphodiesterase class I)